MTAGVFIEQLNPVAAPGRKPFQDQERLYAVASFSSGAFPRITGAHCV